MKTATLLLFAAALGTVSCVEAQAPSGQLAQIVDAKAYRDANDIGVNFGIKNETKFDICVAESEYASDGTGRMLELFDTSGTRLKSNFVGEYLTGDEQLDVLRILPGAIGQVNVDTGNLLEFFIGEPTKARITRIIFPCHLFKRYPVSAREYGSKMGELSNQFQRASSPLLKITAH